MLFWAERSAAEESRRSRIIIIFALHRIHWLAPGMT